LNDLALEKDKMIDPADWVIACVETDSHLGHGETQCRLYVSAMLSFGWKVILAAYDARASSCWISKELPQYAENVFVVPFPRKAGGHKALERWQVIRSLIEKAEKATGWAVDLCFLTWFDELRPRRRQVRDCLGILPYPWVGMYFLPGHFRFGAKMSWLKRLKHMMADRRLFRLTECQGMAILDEGVQTPLQWALRGKPVVVFPEATDNHAVATDEINHVRMKAKGRPIVGQMGHLTPRKGILNFLRAATRFDPDQAFFLIAGELETASFSHSEQEELEKLLRILGHENGYSRLDRIPEASEFNSFFNLCDVHCLVYNDFHHSSGLLAKAAISGIPVIVARGHCMGERVERFGLGITVVENDPESLKAAIRHLIKPGVREKLKASDGFSAYSARNTSHMLESSLQTLCGPR
jgi:glycosyltransferase involved in cell wall biosynthesis